MSADDTTLSVAEFLEFEFYFELAQFLRIQRRLDAHTQDLERDYSSSINQRAHDRTLMTRVHRQHLTGRRNHFVAVPKLVAITELQKSKQSLMREMAM